MRVSYNGYYSSFPNWGSGFDSRHPLQKTPVRKDGVFLNHIHLLLLGKEYMTKVTKIISATSVIIFLVFLFFTAPFIFYFGTIFLGAVENPGLGKMNDALIRPIIVDAHLKNDPSVCYSLPEEERIKFEGVSWLQNVYPRAGCLWGMRESSVDSYNFNLGYFNNILPISGPITLSGTSGPGGVLLTWSLPKEALAPYGFRVIIDTEKDPHILPERSSGDAAEEVYEMGADTRSYLWKKVDEKPYHFRVCIWAHFESGERCGVYSNDVLVTTPSYLEFIKKAEGR